MNKIIKVINILIAVLPILLLSYFLLSGCEGTAYFLKKYIGNTSFYNTIHQIANQFSTPKPDSYRFLLAELFLLTIFFSFMTYKSERIYHYLKNSLVVIKQTIFGFYRELRHTNIIYILILTLPVIISIFYSFYLPPTSDEIVTYNEFVKPSFYKCLIYYPFPNNHIFYSFLCNITELIPGMDILLKMRVISILAFIGSILIGFRFIKKMFSEKLSALTIGISSTLFLTLFYSSMARGYSLLILFFVICLYAAFCIVKENNKPKHWLLFVSSSVLAFYTMPSFLYPFISINLSILLFNYKHISKQIYYNIIIVLLTAILYIPVFIVSGLDMVFSNPDAPQISRNMVIEMLPTLVMWAYGDNFGLNSHIVIIVFFLIGLCALCQIRNNVKLILLWIIFGIIPFIFPIIQGVFPFSRTYIFLGFTLTLLTVATFRKYLNKLDRKIIIIATIFLQIAFIFNYIREVPQYTKGLQGFKAFTDIMLEDKKSYLIQSKENIGRSFVFEAERKSLDCKIIQTQMAELMSTDSISMYDYILIDKDMDATIYRKSVYTIPTRYNMINIYIKE